MRQMALGQGPQIMLLLTNEPGFEKQTVKTNTLASASGTAILQVSDILWNDWRQNKRRKDKCVIAVEDRACLQLNVTLDKKWYHQIEMVFLEV